jgi:hypothetical protein
VQADPAVGGVEVDARSRNAQLAVRAHVDAPGRGFERGEVDPRRSHVHEALGRAAPEGGAWVIGGADLHAAGHAVDGAASGGRRFTTLSGVPFQIAGRLVSELAHWKAPPWRTPSVAYKTEWSAPAGFRSTQLSGVPNHKAACGTPGAGPTRTKPTCIVPRTALNPDERNPGGCNEVQLFEFPNQSEAPCIAPTWRSSSIPLMTAAPSVPENEVHDSGVPAHRPACHEAVGTSQQPP